MSEFENTEWTDKDVVTEFVENADYYIVERRKLFEIARSLFKNTVGKDIGMTSKVLDLGSGDGAFIHELLKTGNKIKGTLFDGSEEMLANARKRLKEYLDIEYVTGTFQDLITGKVSLTRFDFVVSSMAIHHLNKSEKGLLFKNIFEQLEEGGCFVNIDVVLSPSDSLENWYSELWRDWIAETEKKFNPPHSFLHIPQQHKNNTENITDTLEDQLEILKNQGFKNVDCYYKYGIFSVYGGQKLNG